MPKQIPCLWFDGQAEEAAAHYTSIFPNSSVGESNRTALASGSSSRSSRTTVSRLVALTEAPRNTA